MAGSFGGTVKLTGESEYKKALKEITSSLKLVSSELKLTNTQFSNGDRSIKQTKVSYTQMNNALEQQKGKVSDLRKALKEAEREYGKNNITVQDYKRKLNDAENQLKQMEAETNKSNKELKEMKNGFNDAGQGAVKFGDLLKANVLGDFIVGGIKKLGSAVKEVGSAILNVGKQALNSYADYEQLIGGVKTLFKESSGVVEQYANNAYKTAGLSANDYMETVTSFSASLLQSLKGDTEKSAEVADMAITDMSDNANKMGTDMSMIQNAYQGFAKQNYTMLDNLKLGYGGTKTEMERLLADAQKISGIKYDISNLSDVYEAIHVIQTEMKISGLSYEEAMAKVASGEMTLEEATEAMGTTAKEATQTISGSVSAMKSAWQNMLTGIADDNADFEGLVNNLVDSIITAGQNILPRVEVIIDGAAELIVQLIGKILEQMPKILETGSNILTKLIDGITTMIPEISYTAFYIIDELLRGIISNLPLILQMGIDLLTELINGISQTLPDLIPVAIESIITMVTTLLDNIDLIIDTGIELILALADGLIEALPRLIDKIPIIIEKLINAITNNLPKLIEMGITLIVKLGVGLIKAIPQLISKIPQIISSLVNGFKNYFSNMGEVGKNLVSGIWEGIKNAKDWLLGKVKEWCGNILNGIKSFFGIHSPSKVFKDEIGTNLALGLGEGFSNTMKDVSQEMSNSIPTEFDVKSTVNAGTKSQLNIENLTGAFITAIRNLDAQIIIDKDVAGRFVIKSVDSAYGRAV